ncbi:hypothetical protein H8D04_01355 [bacterium]|nr:hypothetical protein [bacterium]
MKKNEKEENKAICEECNGSEFNVYITVIIDDARLYCTNCGTDWSGYTRKQVDTYDGRLK